MKVADQKRHMHNKHIDKNNTDQQKRQQDVKHAAFAGWFSHCSVLNTSWWPPEKQEIKQTFYGVPNSGQWGKVYDVCS